MEPPKYNGPFDDGRKNYVASLPQELQFQICDCERSLKNFPLVNIDERGDFLVCKTCRRPVNLWLYVSECDVCEVFYIVEFFPDEIMLCPPCRIRNDVELPDYKEFHANKLTETKDQWTKRFRQQVDYRMRTENA
jgi:hypothetical protein